MIFATEFTTGIDSEGEMGLEISAFGLGPANLEDNAKAGIVLRFGSADHDRGW